MEHINTPFAFLANSKKKKMEMPVLQNGAGGVALQTLFYANNQMHLCGGFSSGAAGNEDVKYGREIVGCVWHYNSTGEFT